MGNATIITHLGMDIVLQPALHFVNGGVLVSKGGALPMCVHIFGKICTSLMLKVEQTPAWDKERDVAAGIASHKPMPQL